VTREIQGLDGELAPAKVRTMDQLIADSTQRENFNTLLLTVFAAIALLLAAIGIYGLMSYSVEQRTQEIGIRMALGADRGVMMRQVLKQGMVLAAIGIAIGIAAAYELTRFLGALLFGVKSTDPWIYGAVGAILAGVSMIAVLVPAHRATKIDPILALRHE
jgi:putative ABC transport system permease protein